MHILGRGRYASQTYPQRTPSSSGPSADVGPVEFVYWVGVLATPVATPDGSDEAPFSTLSSALAASAALPDFSAIRYNLCDQDYSPEGDQAVSGNKYHRLVGQVPNCRIPRLNVDTGSSGASIEIINCVGQGIVGAGAGSLDIMCSATNGFNGFSSIDTTGVAPTVTIFCQNFTVNGINAPSGVLTMLGGVLTGNVTINSYLRVDGVAVSASFDITVAPVQDGFTNCLFYNGAPSLTGPVGSFLADDLSATQFFNAGGTLLGGATFISLEASGCNGLGNNIVSAFGRAFGAGHTNNGDRSICVGNACQTNAEDSCAIGDSCSTVAPRAFALGHSCNAAALDSFARGDTATSTWASCDTLGGGTAFGAIGSSQVTRVVMTAQAPGNGSAPFALSNAVDSLPCRNGFSYNFIVNAVIQRVGNAALTQNYQTTVLGHCVAGVFTVDDQSFGPGVDPGALGADIVASAVGGTLVLTLTNGIASAVRATLFVDAIESQA